MDDVKKEICLYCKGTGVINIPILQLMKSCSYCQGLGYITKGIGNDPKEFDLLK
jgi:hypothetical protein